jgi:limonene-1,2-epoxide hydrolase
LNGISGDGAEGPVDPDEVGPKATVRAFLAALERLDLDGAMALAADDIVYQNVPLTPARGEQAVRRQLKSMFGMCTGFEARVTHLAADGPVVLTERVDVLRYRAVAVEFWVCGTFEVRDGRITLWRDYFDWTTFLFAGARGLGKALFGAGRDALARRGAVSRAVGGDA